MASKGKLFGGLFKKFGVRGGTSLDTDSPPETSSSGETDKAADELTEQICDLCIEDEQHIPAKVFCNECEQRLCERCHKTHERGKITRAHGIITLHDRKVDKANEKKLIQDEIDKNKFIHSGGVTRSGDVKANSKAISQEHRKGVGNACTYKEKVAEQVGQIHITLITDEDTAIVCAMEVLDETHLVILDSANNKVKVFHIEDELKSDFRLSSKPAGLVMFTETDLLVSLPTEQCLQTLAIKSKIELVPQSKVNTKIRYYRLMKCQDNIIVHAEDDSHRFIFLMDKHGKELRRIITDTKGPGEMFSVIRYISTSADSDVIYVIDRKRGCMGVSLSGKIGFTYKEPGTREHWGVCNDKDGNVYISCPDTDKIVTLNSKGEKTNDLVAVKGMDPGFMGYDQTFDKLFVWGDQVQLMLIFKLKQKV